MHRTRLLVAVISLSTATAMAGCSGGEVGGSASTEINGLLSTDPSTFDPARATGGDDYTIDRLLYDSLLRRDESGLVGGLAERWQAVSPTEYRFTLREGATCSDGTPIGAEVVSDSLTYFADETTGSNFRNLVFGTGDVTVAADGERDVVISLSEPFAGVLDGLTLAQTGIICPAGLADTKGLAAGRVGGAFSGPYVLAEAQPGLRYTLQLREDYDQWPDFAEPLTGTAPTQINYGLTSDVSTSTNQLLSGDLDFAYVQGESVDRLKSDGGFNFATVTIAGMYLIFNEADGRTFVDQRLRRAAAKAIEPKAFNNAFSAGKGPLLTTLVSSSYNCASTDESLLVTADAADTEALDGVKVTVLGSNGLGDGGSGNEYIAEALREAGADIELLSVDNATWATTFNTPGSDWDVLVMADLNATQQVSASLSRVTGPSIAEGGRNIGSIDNQEAADLLAQALKTTDDNKRCDLLKQAQTSLLERVDVVPLTGMITTLVSREGLTVRAFGDYVDMATLRLTDAGN